MKRGRLFAVVALCIASSATLLCSASSLAAPPFNPLPQIAVVPYGGYVNDVFTETFKNRQFNFDVDLDKGHAFYNGQQGIFAFPIKGLSEEQIDKQAAAKSGAPLCHIFLSQGLTLLDKGKPLDQKQLRFAKGINHDGEESFSSCYVCTVRRVEGGKLELCLYAAGKDPILTVPFDKAQSADDPLFDFKLQAGNPNSELTLTLFGKHVATLPFVANGPGTLRPDDFMTARFNSTPQTPGAKPAAFGKPAPTITMTGPPSQLQFDIERSGHWRKGESLPKNPGILWRFPPEGEGTQFTPGTPVADRGFVYFGDTGGNFHALNAADGKEKWTRKYSAQQLTAPPAIVEGLAFVATGEDVKCVSLESGEPKWSHELSGSTGDAPPLVVGDAVIVPVDGGIVALKRASGDELWHHDLQADRPEVSPSFNANFQGNFQKSLRTRAAASDGAFLFQPIYDQCRVVAVDCRTGKRQWSYNARGWLTANPAVSGRYVMFGGFDLYIHCVDRETGKVIWKSPAACEIDAAPAVTNGRVYFTARNSRVHCIDLETGKRIWMYRMDPAVEGIGCDCAILVSDTTAFVGSTSGFLFALDAVTGEQKWGLPLGNRTPINCQGLATDGKRLFASTISYRRPAEAAVFAVGDP
jgi:eukaryotic-like serine/threonine-protein kinase